MKKSSRLGTALLLCCGTFACCKGASHPRTPTAVVKAYFSGMEKIRSAAKAAKAEGATEGAKKNLEEARSDLDGLFLDPKRAKLMMMPLLLLGLKDVEYVDEKIDGNRAEVTIEYTVSGIGLKHKLAESAQQRNRVTFQLREQKGRWKIADVGRVLAKHAE